MIIMFFIAFNSFGQETAYEKSSKKETATYEQTILYYKSLDEQYKQAKLLQYGSTDFGKPLHLFVLSKDQDFDPSSVHKKDKRVLLINNGIHPGEPEGIDASMMLSRDLLKEDRLPEDLVICIIPIYNIGGSHNRYGTSRANQNGPIEYGFRGNSKNYDLNRDFIKTDSKNSATFQLIFNTWKPEIFVDNHTSNGSDFQHVMTLIPTQKDKLNPDLSAYLTESLLPSLYKGMEKDGYPMAPYVSPINITPDKGIKGYLESARYSTGYVSLHNAIGFMPETHSLKDYALRVDATYKLMENFISIIQRDAGLIGENKKKADAYVTKQNDFPLNWVLDDSVVDSVLYKGYEAGVKKSKVSDIDRLYYDRNKPFTKFIKELNTYKASKYIKKPVAYIIPQAWDKVVHLLKINGVDMHQLKEDRKVTVESYYITDFKTLKNPYEGHYLHSGVEVVSVQNELQYYKGDYLVYVNQPSNRYIVEVLEPQASDSFFNWNFFDSILSMKEHFSPYIFEDTSVDILKNQPEIKIALERKKAEDAEFRNDSYAQLDFIYKRSDYYEKTHNRYPIGRILTEINL